MWLHLLLLLLPLMYLIKRRIELKGQKKPLPPGPTKLPIIEIWPIMLLQLGVPTVVVSSAEAAREFLKTHDIDCCSRPPLVGLGKFSYNHQDIAFAPYGDYWREVRKICVHEVFSTKRVQSFQFIREEEVALLIDSIAESSSSGSPMILPRDFKKWFVKPWLCWAGSLQPISFRTWVGLWIDSLVFMEGLRGVSLKWTVFYQRVIEDHLNPGRVKEEHEDIIDVLLKIQRERSESGAVQFTKDSAKAILMDLFLAGVDTGAITLTWAMTELARNQE
ncbi:Cytochrome P450 71B35 [Vitis vinifera]|uniref:Cytochrome P450 71B35 n=1 Tax=Vitis vinifera TaxID=29760 RepID=A0A438E6A6_VITVI|nr:Cytochrome P450 71B35 [Vitis vinifera]